MRIKVTMKCPQPYSHWTDQSEILIILSAGNYVDYCEPIKTGKQNGTNNFLGDISSRESALRICSGKSWEIHQSPLVTE